MSDETVITWDQVRLAARQNLKQWAEGRQMPLYRRRESVTADEVIRHLKERHRGFGVEFIEAAIKEICGKNAIENEPDQRGGLLCVGGPLDGQQCFRAGHHPLKEGDQVNVPLPTKPIEPNEPIYHPFSRKAVERVAPKYALYVYLDGVLKYAERR